VVGARAGRGERRSVNAVRRDRVGIERDAVVGYEMMDDSGPAAASVEIALYQLTESRDASEKTSSVGEKALGPSCGAPWRISTSCAGGTESGPTGLAPHPREPEARG
jgi:hypothetical protein